MTQEQQPKDGGSVPQILNMDLLPAMGILPSELARAFACPMGVLGAMAAAHMAGRSAPDYERAIDILRLRGGTLMEIGCADGAFVQRLYSERCMDHYLGIDHSPDMIAAARERNGEFIDIGAAKFWRRDIAALPIFAGIDTILCMNMLIFVKDLPKFLRDCFDALRFDGMIVLGWPARPPEGSLDAAIAGEVSWRTMDEVQQAMLDVGFKGVFQHEAPEGDARNVGIVTGRRVRDA